MNLLINGQRKISFLFAACFFFILVLSIGFSSALIYRLAHLQATARALYGHSLAISQAGQEMLGDVSRMHDLMLQTLAAPDTRGLAQVGASLQALDAGLRQNLSTVAADAGKFRRTRDEVNHQLDAWHAAYARILDLLQHNHRKEALALGMSSGVQSYGQLNAGMAAFVQEARAHTAALADAAARSTSEAIREAWWILGALALLNALCAVSVLRRISLIMKDDASLVSRLHENEQRLKMALSGGNQGTWDLDATTGKLNFDTQWGNLLGYQDKRDRPATVDQWAARIFSEDRERVLKAINDHIEGRTPEYRAEYRMRGHDGELRWIGGHGKAMHRDSHGRATRVVGITQDITQRKLSEQEIWRLAHTDLLTGLPNRVLLYDRLSQMAAYAGRHDQMFSLLFLDLDGFKEVNDRYGHDIGDKLLQEVAARLGRIIRGEDTMARVGGDEFILILSGIQGREDAATAAGKILGLLHEEFLIGNCRCHIGGSIGIALYPEDSEDMDALVSRADDAMYAAKAKGKNNYQFYRRDGGAA
ncbi:MAG TPA: sensor domain-containing diguanylate cyclase [Gallionellaceae bacterium]|nr:sensor domain-containing diguanylate cyclase [Gallionellaceae bacterium]